MLVCVVSVIFLAAVPAGAQQASLVRVAPVEEKPVKVASQLVGTVEPIVITTLAAEEAARLEERIFDEGQAVEEGDVLARLDDGLLQRQLASAQAAIQSARAVLERAKLSAQNLERERERVTRLYNQSVATEKEYLDAINAHDQSIAQIAVAEADLAEREAQAAELELQIDKCVVVAPFGGVVNERFVEVGQWVQQGDPVAEIVRLDRLFVRTGVPEHVLSQLEAGDEATVTIDALGGQAFTGTISQILPVADPATRTFPVRIEVGNEDGLLRPGMFARTTFTRQDEGQLVVPKDAVTRSAQGTHVVVVENGAATFVPVELGPADELNQVVRGEGLEAGDSVVIRGNESLQPGMPVSVQNPAQEQGQADGAGAPQGN